MKLFHWFSRKKPKHDVPPMPSWEAIVDMMYDQYLDAFADEIVDVLYSKDRSMRYVILKDEQGLFTYQLEALYQLDEDEWKYMCSNSPALPALWEPYKGILGRSLFEKLEELMRELKTEPEYQLYF